MILEVLCLGKIKKFNEWCEGCDKRYSRDFYCYQPTLIYSPHTLGLSGSVSVIGNRGDTYIKGVQAEKGDMRG